MIGRTVESLKGAKRATVHIYLATSDCFRNVVFGLSKEESKALAVKCTKLVRQLTKDDPSTAGTDWDFEFSPETFLTQIWIMLLKYVKQSKKPGANRR